MPLAATDLVEPLGEVAPALFPADAAPPSTAAGSLLARLGAYLADGYARADAYSATLAAPLPTADRDAAARAWAYARAYGAAYQRLTTSPASKAANNGEVQTSYLVTQIQNVRDLRDAALSAFRAIVPAAATVSAPATAAAAPPASRVSPLSFSY